MAISNEQFLFCCIENSNNGTVNWTAVADACGTTKGAASIKYRRMKEKFGTISDGDRAAGDEASSDAAPKKKATTKKTTNKKRKVDEKDEEKAKDDDEAAVKGEDFD